VIFGLSGLRNSVISVRILLFKLQLQLLPPTSAIVTPSSCRATIGDGAFFVAAPRAWNTLPSSVTASETLGTFKRRLKTHLFATSFP